MIGSWYAVLFLTDTDHIDILVSRLFAYTTYAYVRVVANDSMSSSGKWLYQKSIGIHDYQSAGAQPPSPNLELDAASYTISTL